MEVCFWCWVESYRDDVLIIYNLSSQQCYLRGIKFAIYKSVIVLSPGTPQQTKRRMPWGRLIKAVAINLFIFLWFELLLSSFKLNIA